MRGIVDRVRFRRRRADAVGLDALGAELRLVAGAGRHRRQHRAPGYIVLATCSITRYISVSSFDAGDGGRVCGIGTIFTAGSAMTFAISA